jgi:hypothetical protein
MPIWDPEMTWEGRQKESASRASNLLNHEHLRETNDLGMAMGLAAQAWATLAVADAIGRLASAVEALAEQGRGPGSPG